MMQNDPKASAQLTELLKSTSETVEEEHGSTIAECLATARKYGSAPSTPESQVEETPSEGKEGCGCKGTMICKNHAGNITMDVKFAPPSTPSSTEGKYTLEWLFGVYHGEKDSNRRQIIIKEANALLAQAREEEREKCAKRVKQARVTALQEALGVVEEYFHGLIYIPNPQATKKNLLASISRLIEEAKK